MLARVNAAASGICEYLETGRKKGREFERDLVDRRVTLAGNMEVLDAMIESIDTRQAGDARYLHITLGFAEAFTDAQTCGPGQVNLARLTEVAEAYRAALMAAYDPSEYVWYAEAHVPKISHEIDARTGSYVERLPHVHIVLPTRNCESGKYLNPFGFGEHTLWAAEAIQESINQRFGLRSPRDAQRDAETLTHPLGKHEPRFAGKSPSQLKTWVDRLVATGKVRTFEQLGVALAGEGDVRIRHGKEGDYLNVKPAWASRGINFKLLGRESFDSQAADLRAQQPLTALTYAPEADLKRWLQQGAFEARYVATPRMRQAYRAMDEAERVAFLTQRRAETAERLALKERPAVQQLTDEAGRVTREAAERQSTGGTRDLEIHQLNKEIKDGEPRPTGRADGSDRGAAAADRADLREDRRGAQDARRGGQRLGPDAGETVGTAGEQLRSDPGQPRDPTDAQLKALTRPQAVLAVAQTRYGIALKRYRLGVGADGTPRIIHAGRQYNLGDFLTKHLGKTWHEARDVLVEAYKAQTNEQQRKPGTVEEREGFARRAAEAVARGHEAAADPSAFQEGRRRRSLAQNLAAALQRLRGDRTTDQAPVGARNDVELAATAVARGIRDAPTSYDLARTIDRQRRIWTLSAALHRATLSIHRKFPGSSAVHGLRTRGRLEPVDPSRLRRDVDPALVIEAARRLYGIDAADYEIGLSKNGEPRILHQGRQFNTGDFLTKQLRRPWAEARQVLQDCYYASQSEVGPEPNAILWRQFTPWRERQLRAASQARGEFGENFRSQVLSARDRYRAAKLQAQQLPSRLRAKRMARVRAERFVEEKRISQERAAAYEALKPPPRWGHYREFLRTQAGQGDVAALAELRRMSMAQVLEDPAVIGRCSQPVFALPYYVVDPQGGVTYAMREGRVVRDSAQGVAVLRATPGAYDAAIRIAAARYGKVITLRGDQAFVEGMTDAARRVGLELQIHDAARPTALPLNVRGRAGPPKDR